MEALTWINAWPTSREEKRDETTATRPLAPSVRNFSPVEHASQRVADLAPRKRERLARQQLSHGGAAGAAADAEFFRDKRARGEADGAAECDLRPAV